MAEAPNNWLKGVHVKLVSEMLGHSTITLMLATYSHVVPATTSYAAYGQATWNPTKRWHFTGGLRATLEHKTGSYDAYPQGNVTPIDSFPADQQAAVAASRAALAPTGDQESSPMGPSMYIATTTRR